VAATGPAADNVVAFDRGGAVTVGTRLPVRLGREGGWRDTTIAVSGTDLLTGRPYRGETRLADLLADYPVALLAP
jgi:(1->4)-alpha-D-glucan 1-alpha-D-glucosylmutase